MTYNRRQPPPQRQGNQPDAFDGARIDYFGGRWRSQDQALRQRDRSIEENVRMLCGQHWTAWNSVTGRFYDISEWLTEAERRWRQRPAVLWVQMWFIITHARLTENPPILTFLPGPDRIDAELADVQDRIFKLQWRQAGMTDVVDRMMTWMIPAGRVHLGSRIDPHKGDWKKWIGHADSLPIVGANGQPIPNPQTGQPLDTATAARMGMLPPQVAQGFDDIPFDEKGNPRAVFTPDGPQMTGPPHAEREGLISADIFSPLEARGQWGPMPWHEKRWHGTCGYFTPEQVWEQWQVEVEPDTNYDESGAGTLDRLLFGTGFYGAATGRWATGTGGLEQAREGLCTVHQNWEAPDPTQPDSPENPGGRHIIWTPKKVIRDGPRGAAFPYTSPIRCFDFVRIPGRPSGTSPQDMLNGPNRSYNKLRAQSMEHANLCSNPKYVKDSGAGEFVWTNEPGTGITVTRRPNVPAVEWLVPPPLGDDVYKNMDLARGEIFELGFITGTQGEPLSPEQSGEAIKELRFNSDRFLGPTTRRAVEEFGRLAEDWMVLTPLIYDTARIISASGEDNVATTIMVQPELFKLGKVNVVPDVESMLPEGRGERQAQTYQLWKDGAYNTPDDPFGVRTFMEQMRFPHLARSARPGGVDRVTAEQENGKLIQGAPFQEIPVLPWYDHIVHLTEHERLMKSPEFLKLSPEIQFNFEQHWMAHQQQMMIAARPRGAPMPPGGAKGAGGGTSQQIAPGIPSNPQSVPPGEMPTALAPAPVGITQPA